jgi:GT2 family glycosyltransferase
MNDRHYPLGLVAIGRNEGGRLKDCLASVAGRGGAEFRGFPVVYVDSGSTDGSPALARSMGAQVVDLDLSRPFSAARARNEGFARLIGVAPEVQYVQFLDGDCILTDGWLEVARDFLARHPDYAVVCGRRRERFPEASVYNRLCDLEWDTPVGEAKACGGDALMRTAAFQQTGGFDPTMVAGEEPELCVRLRREGWRVRRLDADMTAHDAAMTRWGQWWQRSVRGGYAYAAGAWMHGRSPERHEVRACGSIWFWGAAVPLAVMLSGWWRWWLPAVILLAYPLSLVRIAHALRGRAWLPRHRWWYAAHCVLGKFPQLAGQVRFLWRRLRRRPPTILEYKTAAGPAPAAYRVAPASHVGPSVMDPAAGLVEADRKET